MNKQKTEIKNLYKIKKSDKNKMYNTLMSAFKEYPKLISTFSEKSVRLAALEATIRYYGEYDFHYGCGYSLDDSVSEVALLVHSDEMHYTLPRHIISGSYGKGYRDAMNRLSRENRKKRIALFEEVDALEKDIKIPYPHIYLDFLGTEKALQGQGRGRKLMSCICAHSDIVQLPIMLFTNTDADIFFYKSLGFKTIGIAKSERFGFVNTYLLYEPK